MELDESSLEANIQKLFDGYLEVTQLPDGVAAQEVSAHGPTDITSMTTGNNQTAVFIQQSPSMSHGTTSHTSLQQLPNSHEHGSGQTLGDFLAHVEGLPTEGLMSDNQFNGIMDNTSCVTPCSMTNTTTSSYSYNTAQNNVSEGMDLIETTDITDLNDLSSVQLNTENLRQLADLVQYSGLSADDLTMDQSIQYVDTGSCPPITSTALTTAVLEQGLQQFQQNIHVRYNAEVLAPDGSDDSSDTSKWLDTTEQQPDETETTNITDLLSQARSRRKMRRNQSRLSESSADVNSPEYKEFLNSLSGQDRKKELNRQAAKRCRDKKFQEEIRLEEKAKSLRRVNSQLKAEKARLQQEAHMLKQQRLTRQMSACT